MRAGEREEEKGLQRAKGAVWREDECSRDTVPIAQACLWPGQSWRTRPSLVTTFGPRNRGWGSIVISRYGFGADGSLEFYFSLFNFNFLSALRAKSSCNKLAQLYLWGQRSSFQKATLAIGFEGSLLLPLVFPIHSMLCLSHVRFAFAFCKDFPVHLFGDEKLRQIFFFKKIIPKG